MFFLEEQNTEYFLKGGVGIGDLFIKIYDRKHVLVYDNAMAQVWDFENKATQNFTLIVKFPIEVEEYNNVTGRGCIALVIGYLQNN